MKSKNGARDPVSIIIAGGSMARLQSRARWRYSPMWEGAWIIDLKTYLCRILFECDGKRPPISR